MKYTPRNDWVLVRLDEEDESKKKSNSILLRKEDEDERKEATVLDIGPGRIAMDGSRIPINLAPDQRVLIHNFVGQPVGPKKERLFLVREESIYCTEHDIL
jgi:co-chaperonin GroES (HSP10)